MSLECMSWAKRQRIAKPGAKLVLLCLADHASEKNDYRCWAGRKSISEEASMSVRAVTTHLNWLEENGFIKREQRFRNDGSQTTNYITLSMASPSADSARGGEEIARPSADSAPHEPVTNRYDDDAKARARIVHETGEQVADAMGVKDDPNWFGDYSRIHAWIAQGFDPQLDIVPAVQAVMKRRRGQPPPKSLRYFDQPVAAYHENRTRPVDHDPSTTTSSQQFSNRRPNDPHNEWLAAFAEVGSE